MVLNWLVFYGSLILRGWVVTSCQLGCHVMGHSGLIGLRRVVQTCSVVHVIAPVTATLAGSVALSGRGH